MEVELGGRRPRAYEDGGARHAKRLSRDPGNQFRVVIATPPPPLGVDRHRHDDVAARGGSLPATGDGSAQRAREPLLAAVLELVQGAPDDVGERRTPLELQERRRDVRWQADRDPGRQVEPRVERGRARGADRLALRATAGAARRERGVEGAPYQAADRWHGRDLARRLFASGSRGSRG